MSQSSWIRRYIRITYYYYRHSEFCKLLHLQQARVFFTAFTVTVNYVLHLQRLPATNSASFFFFFFLQHSSIITVNCYICHKLGVFFFFFFTAFTVTVNYVLHLQRLPATSSASFFTAFIVTVNCCTCHKLCLFFSFFFYSVHRHRELLHLPQLQARCLFFFFLQRSPSP